MNDTVKLGVTLAIAAAIFLGGWVVRGWSDNSAQLKTEQAIEKTQAIAADAIAKISATSTTVQQKTIHEVVQYPIYQECKHSPAEWATIQEAFK